MYSRAKQRKTGTKVLGCSSWSLDSRRVDRAPQSVRGESRHRFSCAKQRDCIRTPTHRSLGALARTVMRLGIPGAARVGFLLDKRPMPFFDLRGRVVRSGVGPQQTGPVLHSFLRSKCNNRVPENGKPETYKVCVPYCSFRLNR